MKLIVGLGNPGRAYVNSRHNVGFRCVDIFAKNCGIELSKIRSRARTGTGEVCGEKVILAKPRTYMNLSGESVVPLMRYFKLNPSDVLVIYDDVDIPLGKIRIREKGGSGGHNGLNSIIGLMGSQEFPRIRVGIGSEMIDEAAVEHHPKRTPEYVLGRFSPAEQNIIDEICPTVAEAITCVIREGIAASMNKYNSL